MTGACSSDPKSPDDSVDHDANDDRDEEGQVF